MEGQCQSPHRIVGQGSKERGGVFHSLVSSGLSCQFRVLFTKLVVRLCLLRWFGHHKRRYSEVWSTHIVPTTILLHWLHIRVTPYNLLTLLGIIITCCLRVFCTTCLSYKNLYNSSKGYASMVIAFQLLDKGLFHISSSLGWLTIPVSDTASLSDGLGYTRREKEYSNTLEIWPSEQLRLSESIWCVFFHHPDSYHPYRNHVLNGYVFPLW